MQESVPVHGSEVYSFSEGSNAPKNGRGKGIKEKLGKKFAIHLPHWS